MSAAGPDRAGMPRLSILIPTLNAEGDLTRLLPALRRQDCAGGWELRVIDSDSSDGTRAILKAEGVNYEAIARHEFQHGLTRNRLAAAAEGELLVFLSQDTLPCGTDFLERLCEPFEDPLVAGVTCRVLPHADDDPLTRRTVLEAPEGSQEPRVQHLGPGVDLDALEHRERAALLRFNNVASAIRASVLAEIPFPETPFGEDSAWAGEALRAGWKIVFHPDAVVRHAHTYSALEAFERYRVDAAFHRRVHGLLTRPGLTDVLRGVTYEVLSDLRLVVRERRGWLHLLRSPGLRTAQVLGQWFGTRGWRGISRSEFV